MKQLSLLAFCLLVSLLVSSGLSGCASMGASSTESFLSAAGFTPMQPKNAAQQPAYDNLKPYKMETGIITGKRLYGYKDEKKGVVYVGNEAQYQEFQRTLIQSHIANDNMMAAQMN
uniref:hypothetical protein n=1 Tax=Escherichia coli TaxID=562 RepID=UPI002FCB43D4